MNTCACHQESLSLSSSPPRCATPCAASLAVETDDAEHTTALPRHCTTTRLAPNTFTPALQTESFITTKLPASGSAFARQTLSATHATSAQSPHSVPTHSAHAPAVLSSLTVSRLCAKNPTPSQVKIFRSGVQPPAHREQRGASARCERRGSINEVRASPKALAASPRLAYHAKPIKPRHIH
jgi:hypothetical protein